MFSNNCFHSNIPKDIIHITETGNNFLTGVWLKAWRCGCCFWPPMFSGSTPQIPESFELFRILIVLCLYSHCIWQIAALMASVTQTFRCGKPKLSKSFSKSLRFWYLLPNYSWRISQFSQNESGDSPKETQHKPLFKSVRENVKAGLSCKVHVKSNPDERTAFIYHIIREHVGP